MQVLAMKVPQFAPEVMREIRLLQRLDNWHGPVEAAFHWSIIAAAIALSMLAWRELPLAAAIAVYVVALVVIGGRQRGLSGLVHQASHGTFMASAHGNAVFAALLGGYPVLQSYTGYQQSHVVLHHGRFGSAKDPDYAFFRDAGLYEEGADSRRLNRYLFGLLSPIAVMRYVGFVIRSRIWTSDDSQSERLGRLLYYVAAIAAISWFDVWPYVLGYWFVPLVTTQAWIGALSELAEHYPFMNRSQRGLIRMSRNRDFGPAWRLLIGEHRGEGYHLVHHLFPRLPIWNLHRAHRVLLADADYAAMPFARSPRQVLHGMRLAL